jgi:glycerophosphoryl diester phosphodiesterase
VRNELLSGSMTAIGPGVALLRADPDYVARAHAAGKQVHVWTANTPADMDFLIGLEVDAVITDHPDELLRRLGRAPAA